MRRWLLIAGCVLGTGSIAVLIAGWGVYQAAQAEPDFYERALQQEPASQQAAGAALEREFLEIQEEVINTGRWQATITDEQINGWLASELTRKFPHLLPAQVKEPRVAISQDRIQVACRYEGSPLKTVISFDLLMTLADESNTLEVQVASARAGLVHVPLRQFLDKVAAVAQTTQIDFRWTKTDGDPIALIKIPTDHEDYVLRDVHIDEFELRQGEVYLAGYTALPRRLVNRPSPHSLAHSARHVTVQR